MSEVPLQGAFCKSTELHKFSPLIYVYFIEGGEALEPFSSKQVEAHKMVVP
jgi:hypothetical protein